MIHNVRGKCLCFPPIAEVSQKRQTYLLLNMCITTRGVRSAIRGDGRCMFRAIVRCIGMDQGLGVLPERVERKFADYLREIAVANIVQNRNSVLDAHLVDENTTFDSYVHEMSHVFTYGGEPELLLLSIALNLRIEVYLPGKTEKIKYRRISVYGKGDPSRQAIRLLFSPEKEHYDAIVDRAHVRVARRVLRRGRGRKRNDATPKNIRAKIQRLYAFFKSLIGNCVSYLCA